ncbi:LysR family transcriptional regulator [Pseudomonas putida]|uniref:LysR family transcriptional regulator n=1 Tax=Pseudomonas TaxID=286 RepID=UPI00216942D2|nr:MULTISPECIES: LysR family transcriptional regulator [Pseudomonas]MCS4061102.1 DNA-binding transcriptional LysR family regulator [Pseudomonas putida]MCX2889111.1 LysR family transcriptional regulator [Pseudomonas sp. DCB_BI]
MRENLNDLFALLTVARERNFTRAAAQLGISQSALSRTISALETRMGLRLLTRTTRSVSPTEAGRRVLAAITPRFEEIDAELEALSDLRDRPTGTVRITTTDYATQAYVWPRLKLLLHEYPDIRVELINDYGLANIVEQSYDIGIRLGDQVEKDMIAARISPDLTMAIVGAPHYLAANGPCVTPQDLTHHNCINLRLPTRDSLMPWELSKGGRDLQVRVDGQWVFNSTYQMLEAALEGFGLAYVPFDLAKPHVETGQLAWVLEEWFPTYPGYHLFYPSRRQTSQAVALVVQALKAGSSAT